MSKIVDAVKSKYGQVATSGLSSDHAGVRSVAEAFGYTPEDLNSIPAEANMGLSCGNPTAFASLQPGRGRRRPGLRRRSGRFLGGGESWTNGPAIGIDMTSEMLALAQANAARSGLANVEFHQATIDQLPLADASVNCVI